MTTERRMTPGDIILRRDGLEGPVTVSGYAAVFYRADDPGTEYKLSPRMVERIDPRAFDRALVEKDDARALFNHDPDNLLARVSADTLRLSIDDRGLRYSFEANEQDPDHLRVLEKIRRKDLTGSSFSFTVDAQRFDKGENGAPNVRTILGVSLLDVGPVTFPAYTGTSTGADRALQGAQEAEEAFLTWEQAEQFRKEMKASQAQIEACRRRLIRRGFGSDLDT